MERWHDFFVAIIGATGALLGLLFVAVSLSIDRIISSKGLPKAMLQPLCLLLGALIASLWFLIPGQSRVFLGGELMGTGLFTGLLMLSNDLSVLRAAPKNKRQHYMSNIAFNQLPNLLILVAGLAVAVCGASGAYLMVPALVLTFVQVVTISWAVMIEIHLHPSGGRWTDN